MNPQCLRHLTVWQLGSKRENPQSEHFRRSRGEPAELLRPRVPSVTVLHSVAEQVTRRCRFRGRGIRYQLDVSSSMLT